MAVMIADCLLEACKNNILFSVLLCKKKQTNNIFKICGGMLGWSYQKPQKPHVECRCRDGSVPAIHVMYKYNPIPTSFLLESALPSNFIAYM